MNERLRLLEGLTVERLSVEQALHEIGRIATNTLGDMSPGYYIERLDAIAALAAAAANKVRETT
jgi:hypothetical protein